MIGTRIGVGVGVGAAGSKRPRGYDNDLNMSTQSSMNPRGADNSIVYERDVRRDLGERHCPPGVDGARWEWGGYPGEMRERE
jgi:hypothetical protein